MSAASLETYSLVGSLCLRSPYCARSITLLEVTLPRPKQQERQWAPLLA